MSTQAWGLREAIARPSRWEMLMTVLAMAHGLALYQSPSVALIALGLWWNSNTISHNFIHRPFFRWRGANIFFGAYLSVLLGIPQSLWRDRHLAHHAGTRPRLRLSNELFLQVALVVGLWTWMDVRAPRFFFGTYLPGYLAGLCLCAMHGYFEHARGVISHYGRIYNTLFFNDGYHAEHHANPAIHWTCLPRHRERQAHASAWPAVLRWIDFLNLEGLERLALWWPALRRFVLRAHARALREIVEALPPIERVRIVGGGIFPRTALIIERLLPDARITIIDANQMNLDEAREYLRREGPRSNINFLHARYPQPDTDDYDLLIIPLSFSGDRAAIYQHPPVAAVIIHDWIWRRRGISRIVSVWMLKRMNL